ncbi:MAG: [LysW]-aminoadipate kinase [Phycisphaerales bacterium]|nr:[LysW]-aminoadipate kinase [Phycisphaerales bacterium]
MATLVIKIGGGKGIDPTSLCSEIAALVREGHRVVLVHGGSHETDQLARALGHPPRTIVSPSGHESRRTDRRTLEIFEMAYCGKVNKGLVEALRTLGVDAIGLSGIDAGIWTGTRKGAIRAVENGVTLLIRDDLSGKVDSVDATFLNVLLDAGKTPVLTPPAITPEGVAINVDADRAAAATATALHADELLLLSNVVGVLRDPSDPSSLIARVDADAFSEASDAAKGRMKNKVLASEEAIRGGVSRVVIGSALGENAIAAARDGAGTVFESGVRA